MQLLNLEFLKCRVANLSGDVLYHLDRTTSTVTTAAPVVGMRLLKGSREDVSNVLDVTQISEVSLEIIYRELIQYSRHNLPAAHCYPEDDAMLRSFPVELLTQLKSWFVHSKKPMFT